MILKKKPKSIRWKLFGVAFLLVAVIFGFDARLRPMIKTYSTNQAAMHVTNIINKSVYEEIVSNKIEYNNLVNLTYDELGEVTSLQTNMLELNQLQSCITNRVIDHMLDFDNQVVMISLGALLGGPMFSGRGPEIAVKLIPSNFIKTDIVNHFDSAGINQTRHRVVMEIELTVSAVMPGYRSSTTVTSNVVLAETIIVGTVPEAFTKVSDGGDPLIGMIQDYGAIVE